MELYGDIVKDSKYIFGSVNEYIVVMKKLPETLDDENSNWVVNPLYARFKCDAVIPILIFAKFNPREIIDEIDADFKLSNNNGPHGTKAVYRVGQKTYIDNYDNKQHGRGISYYRSIEPAYYNNLESSKTQKTWYNDGAKLAEDIQTGNIRNITTWHRNQQIENKYTLVQTSNPKGYFKQWVRHGKFVAHDDKGNVIEGGEYIYDKKTGIWITGSVQYSGAGNLRHKKQTGRYIDGIKDGKWYTYRTNGTLKHEETYRADEAYRVDKRHGLSTIYRQNGTKLSTTNYIYGEREGKSISYHPDGYIDTETSYIADKQQGLSISYYPNGPWYSKYGKIKEYGKYVNGMKTGKFTYVNEYGQKICTKLFINGKEIDSTHYRTTFAASTTPITIYNERHIARHNKIIRNEFNFAPTPPKRFITNTTYKTQFDIQSYLPIIAKIVAKIIT